MVRNVNDSQAITMSFRTEWLCRLARRSVFFVPHSGVVFLVSGRPRGNAIDFRTKSRVTFVLLFTGSVLLGCNGDGPRGLAESGADSTLLLTIDSLPYVQLGGDATDDSINTIGYAIGATRLANGVIAVADGYLPGIHFFTATGEPLRIVGRRGMGPQEFRGIQAFLGQCSADSVYVWDGMLRQVSVIDTAGNVSRRFSLDGDPGLLSCSRTGVLAVISNPATTVQQLSASSPHYTGEMTLRDTNGAFLISLGQIPFAEMRPLGKLTRFALASDRMYVGTADSAFIDVYTLDGRHTGVLPVGTAPRPPSARHYDRALDAMVAPLLDRDYRETWKRTLEQIPMPEHLPPYTAILTDEDGYLWVVTSAPGDGATRIRVLSKTGDATVDLDLPSELTVFEVGDDYLLGMYEAESGAQHVVMYRLKRS